MRTFLPRPLAFAVVGLAVALSSNALAQPDEPEEITVRGRKTLEEYRLDLVAARDELVEAYNEANSSDANDIVCRNERVTGTRMPQRVCRSRAQSKAEASAAMNWLRGMTHSSGRYQTPPGQASQEAIAPITQVNAEIGAAAAQIGGELLSNQSRAAIEAELEELKRTNRQVYRAVVKYLEAEDDYKRARGIAVER